MRHLNDGELRAALDGELHGSRAQHLQGCEVCQQRLSAVSTQAQCTTQHLSFLAPESDDIHPAPRVALARFRNQYELKQEEHMLHKLLTARWLRFGLTAALLITLVLTIPTTRAWAGQLLALFRVRQVGVISVDMSGLQQLSSDSTLGRQLSQLIARSMTVTRDAGNPQLVLSVEEAGQTAGFAVRLPDQATSTPALYVQGETAFEFIVDRGRAQALLEEAGRKDLVLPTTLDGARIQVEIPANVTAYYGTCPSPDSGDPDDGVGTGSASRRFPDCVVLAQMPSPTVQAPADVDVPQLAEIALEFTGMSREQAQAFVQTVDWTSSLVVPVPKNATTYRQVPVDGVTGTLIQRPSDDGPQYLLLWVKDGILYTIAGLGSNSQQAIEMANSMQ